MISVESCDCSFTDSVVGTFFSHILVINENFVNLRPSMDRHRGKPWLNNQFLKFNKKNKSMRKDKREVKKRENYDRMEGSEN